MYVLLAWAFVLIFMDSGGSYLVGKSRRVQAVSQALFAKKKTGPEEKFVCESCGVEHIRWVGRCDSCGEWNTVKAFKASRVNPMLPLDPRGSSSATRIRTQGGKLSGLTSPSMSSSRTSSSASWSPSGTGALKYNSSVLELSRVNVSQATSRVKLWSSELNRVLGGGLVRGSATLLAGEPGIGKSTLLAQLASSLARSSPGGVVYISGEENAEQIAARAHRLGLPVDNVYLLCDTDVDYVLDTVLDLEHTPALIVVDSIQTMRVDACASSMGSVTHVREATLKFVTAAKSTGASVVLVGHATKAGEVAGPRVLEHMVDTVLYMEGSEHADYRLLKGMKNRFGSTSEVGVFAMEPNGMQDVANPSELFMSSAVLHQGGEGSAVAVILEGTRPILAEVQCLVGSHNGMKMSPRRTADGLAMQRLQLICAVLEKRLGLDLGQRDVFLNVVGGLKLTEPSADLAVAVTIVSSLLDVPVRPGVACVGELGLGGEVRRSKSIDIRIAEARSMGFKTIVVPHGKGMRRGNSGSGSGGMASDKNVAFVGNIREALTAVLDCADLDDVLRTRSRRRRGGDKEGGGSRKGSRFSSSPRSARASDGNDGDGNDGGEVYVHSEGDDTSEGSDWRARLLN